jgi:Uma2 family endonuclease
MAIQAPPYVELIEHLPDGATLTIPEVSWEDYEELLKDLGDAYAVRVSYDNGRLEIMSPSKMHEMYEQLLVRLVDSIAVAMDFPLESLGSTTLKKKRLAKGAEPDTCFYIQNAAAIIGKRVLDLNTDPAPDIVVEIDVSRGSINKMAFYASLGVSEFWRYDERQAQIYKLIDGAYVEVPASTIFPILTSQLLTDVFEQSKTEGQSGALSSFRKLLRGNKD